MHFFFGPVCPLVSQVAAVFSRNSLAFRDFYKLLVSCSLLRRLKLHSATLLFKVALYAISFLSQALSEALLSLIPSQLFLLLESVLLRSEPRLKVFLL